MVDHHYKAKAPPRELHPQRHFRLAGFTRLPKARVPTHLKAIFYPGSPPFRLQFCLFTPFLVARLIPFFRRNSWNPLSLSNARLRAASTSSASTGVSFSVSS